MGERRGLMKAGVDGADSLSRPPLISRPCAISNLSSLFSIHHPPSTIHPA